MTTKGGVTDQRCRMETESIAADLYCELLTSRRTLSRSDDEALRIRGLWAPEIGIRYVVEDSTLQRHASSAPLVTAKQSPEEFYSLPANARPRAGVDSKPVRAS